MATWNSTRECKEETCPRGYTDTAIGKAAAVREGWYIGRNNHAYCPNHVPEWVEQWRKRLKTVNLDG